MITTTENPAAVADYACVLSEAAYVLSALVESGTSDRYSEFQVLQCIYSEAVTSELMVCLHAKDSHRNAPLAHHLSSMFSSVMAIGAILTPYDGDELPPVAVLGVHTIERLTKALTRALDGSDEDRNLEIVFEESLALEPHPPNVPAPPKPINALSSIALADARMASFTAQLASA